MKATVQAALIAVLVGMAVDSSGASEGEVPPPDDPLAPLNRKVLAFNYVLDSALLRPASVV